MLRKVFDWVFEKMGYSPIRDQLIGSVQEDKKARAKKLARFIFGTGGNTDPMGMVKAQDELIKLLMEDPEVKKIAYKNFVPLSEKKNKYVSATDVWEYKPAMSRLYAIFRRNPFGAYAFIARYYWAVKTGVQVIRKEIINDGFNLKSNSRSYKRRLRDIYRLIKNLKIPQLRVNIASHLKLYGNAWVLPEKNSLGGYRFTLLAPNRILPIIDSTTDTIVGWEYKVGTQTINYSLSQILHIYDYNVDNYREIGDPPLAPALLSVEAAMSAEGYHAQIFRTGGLWGHILNFEDAPNDDPFAMDSEEYIEEVQDRIDSQLSGMKNAGGVVAMTRLKNVFDISPIGKIDKSFDSLDKAVPKIVANCMDIPPEKLSISRSETLQYIPTAVENVINSDFDKAINALMMLVDDFINDVLFVKYLGIDDVRIIASGRYGAFTKNAADALKAIADAGPFLTVNQGLDWILGLPMVPADNPRGNIVVNNVPGRKVDQPYSPAMDPTPEDYDFAKTWTAKQLLDFVNSDEYSKILRGAYEKNDVTYSGDDVSCDLVTIKRGEVNYYETIRKR